MSDRGIKKWAPYKTLSNQDFTMSKQKTEEEKIEKPTISAEFAEEINNILINYHGETLLIGYFKNGKINYVNDKIKKIDTFDRKLVLVSRKSISLNDIVSLEISEEEKL